MPEPFPEELALGNIVKLKTPYLHRYEFGIIVEQVGYAIGGPQVSLHLYTSEGNLYMGPNNIPSYVDFVASEFVLWKIARKLGYVLEYKSIVGGV